MKLSKVGALLLVLSWSSTGLIYAGGQKEAAFQGVKVVAAENFYGDLIQQVGGSHVQVLSIISDPNVDPHEYESNVADAKAIANADLVWENGSGYDDWMDKLLSASPNANRVVVKGYDVAPIHLPENEHVWYDPRNDLAFAKKIDDLLKQADPADAAEFDANYAQLVSGLNKVVDRLSALKAKYNGTPIGLTETIFLYQPQLIGLNVLTPFEFMKSIAEGNDPPAADAVEAEAQVTGKKVKVVVYNEQTVSDVTTKVQNDAKAAGIPIVPVTETMTGGPHFQDWMLAQLDVLDKALNR